MNLAPLHPLRPGAEYDTAAPMGGRSSSSGLAALVGGPFPPDPGRPPEPPILPPDPVEDPPDLPEPGPDLPPLPEGDPSREPRRDPEPEPPPFRDPVDPTDPPARMG
ncbi:MAG: hypothetical protein J0I31_17885 [Rhizobiales bacterium]|nr:hypothetical protein [Hyphomicrobiales bacterium]